MAFLFYSFFFSSNEWDGLTDKDDCGVPQDSFAACSVGFNPVLNTNPSSWGFCFLLQVPLMDKSQVKETLREALRTQLQQPSWWEMSSLLTFQKVCLSVRDIGNRSVQRQSEGEFLATDLEGLDTMWEHRMLSIWRKCVRLRRWEEIKYMGWKANVFSSDGLLRHTLSAPSLWSSYPAQRGEAQGETLHLQPHRKWESLGKGPDSVLIGPFRQSHWSRVSWSGKERSKTVSLYFAWPHRRWKIAL